MRSELPEKARDAMLAKGIAQPTLTVVHAHAHRGTRNAKGGVRVLRLGKIIFEVDNIWVSLDRGYAIMLKP